MGATILFWRPYDSRKAFGHATLVVYHDNSTVDSGQVTVNDPVRNVDYQMQSNHVATISWFAGDGVSSGESGGFGSSSTKHSVLPLPVHRELQDYGRKGFDLRHQELQQRKMELRRQGVRRTDQAFKDVEQQIKILRDRYPAVGAANSQDKGWVKKYFQRAFPNQRQTVNELMQTRVRPPNERVTIPTLSDDGVHIGLNDVAMIDWWNAFSHKYNTYSLLNRNCASTCAGALIAGGSAYYAKKPRVAPCWMPMDVIKWGKKIRDKVQEIETSFGRSKAYLQNPRVRPDLLRDVWSVKTWKRESDAGRFSRRYGRLQSIDKALELYHVSTGDMGRPAIRNIKLQNLVGIVVLLALLLKERPNTKRKQAVVTLGQQALAKIEYLKTEQKSVRLDQEFRNIVHKYEQEYDFRSWEEMQTLLKQELFWGGDNSASIEEDLEELNQITEQLKYVPGFEQSRFNVDLMPGMRLGQHDMIDDYQGQQQQQLHQPPPLHLGLNPWEMG